MGCPSLFVSHFLGLSPTLLVYICVFTGGMTTVFLGGCESAFPNKTALTFVLGGGSFEFPSSSGSSRPINQHGSGLLHQPSLLVQSAPSSPGAPRRGRNVLNSVRSKKKAGSQACVVAVARRRGPRGLTPAGASSGTPRSLVRAHSPPQRARGGLLELPRLPTRCASAATALSKRRAAGIRRNWCWARETRSSSSERHGPPRGLWSARTHKAG